MFWMKVTRAWEKESIIFDGGGEAGGVCWWSLLYEMAKLTSQAQGSWHNEGGWRSRTALYLVMYGLSFWRQAESILLPSGKGDEWCKGPWCSKAWATFEYYENWRQKPWLLCWMQILMSRHFGKSLSLFSNSKISNFAAPDIFDIEDGGGLKATIGVVDLFRSNWVFNTGSKIEIDKNKSWTSWYTMLGKYITQLKIGGKLIITYFSHSISPHEIWITRWILLSLSLCLRLSMWSSSWASIHDFQELSKSRCLPRFEITQMLFRLPNTMSLCTIPCLSREL